MENAHHEIPPTSGFASPRRRSKLIIGTVIFVLGFIGGAAFLNHLLKQKEETRVREESKGVQPPAPVSQTPAPSPQPAVPGPQPPPQPKVAETPSLPPEQAAKCAKDLEDIRKLLATIPEDYRMAPSLEKMTKDAQICRDSCEAFLKGCPEATDSHEVRYFLAKLLLMLNRVEWLNYIQDERKKGKDDAAITASRKDWESRYFGRVIDLCISALQKFPSASPLRAKCIDLLADAYLQAGEPQKALERYQEVLKELPEYPNRANVLLGIARAHLDLAKYPDGIQVIRKAMTELPDDSNFPSFLELLWQLQYYAGDLKGLLAAVEEMREIIPARLKDEKKGRIEKESLDRSLAYSGFRLGYARFALGDFNGAEQAFRDHIHYLESLQKQNGSIPQDYTVYLGRSKDNADVLETRVTRPAPLEIEMVQWAGSKRPEFPGKPLALVFRNYGDGRSSKFLQILSRHVKAREGVFEFAVVSFLKGGASLQDQMVEALQELHELEVDCPLGLDPDAERKQVFGAFRATVGSATFVIIDATGAYVWFQQDPWQRDERFSLAVLDRIIGAK